MLLLYEIQTALLHGVTHRTLHSSVELLIPISPPEVASSHAIGDPFVIAAYGTTAVSVIPFVLWV